MHERNRSDRSDRSYHNSNDQGGYRRPRIDHWITEKTVIEEQATDGRHPLKLQVIIERPKFLNGDLGFCRLMATITVGDYHVRLPAKSLRTLMSWLDNGKEAILDAIEEIYDVNEAQNTKMHQHRSPEHNRSRHSPSDRGGQSRRSEPSRTRNQRSRGNYRD